MKRKILSLILVLCMVVSMLPTVVFAESAIIASGACGAEGDNVRWVLMQDGTLTISGEGDMANSNSDWEQPWGDLGDWIKTVIIGQGVTSIGDYTFAFCDMLSNITIPDSVTSIGDGAFVDCNYLSSIALPDSVTSIGDGAFSMCSSLNSIAIPDGVTSINHGVFSSCENLNGVVIPDSVSSIGDYAFAHCKSLSGITIPKSVTSIGDSAFSDCSSLSSIAIPDSVSSIGSNVFVRCNNLTGIWVDSNNPNYSSDEYGVLFNKSKTELIAAPKRLSGEYTVPDSVTAIGDYAFEGCEILSSIVIPDSVTSIGDHAFADCKSLSGIIVPKSVTSIGNNAFQYCGSLSSIDIPDGVRSIGRGVFAYCSNLNNITIPDSVTSIGDGAFSYCESLSNITIPGSVKRIGTGAFQNCEKLSNITIPDGVTTIQTDTFEYCSSLASIVIPDSVTYIGRDAFYYCNSLKDIYYCGSESQWAEITIRDDLAYYLTGVTLHFHFSPGNVPDEPSNENSEYTNISFHYRPGVGSADQTYSGMTFKDEWLMQDSYVYNHDLATMSLGLAMAGFESHSNTPDGNILALYEDLGFNPDSFVTAGYGKEDNDTVAIAVATKTIYDEDGQGVPLVAVTLRGGGYGNGGWAGNFAVDSSGVYHRGFYQAASYVRNFVANYLSENKLDSDNVRIWLTGFSRSAATANLASVFLSNAGLVRRENIYTYTFATPNNQQMRRFQSENNNIFNVINEIDLVPMVPLLEWNFGKQGSSMYILDPRTMSFVDNGSALAEFRAEFSTITGTYYKSYINHSRYLTILRGILSDAFPNREHYSFYLQNGMEKAANSGWKDLSGFDHLFSGVTTTEELMSLISGMYYVEAATEILVAIDVRKELSGDNDPILKLLESVHEVLIGAFFEKIGAIDSTSNQELIGVVRNLLSDGGSSETLMQHWPEVYLAWMTSTDGEYLRLTADFTTVSVDCPVDVEIYDALGNLVARSYTETYTDNDNTSNSLSLIDESVTSLAAVAVGQAKYFTLPQGDEYEVVITTNDSYVPGDTMDYEIIEQSGGEIVRMVKFEQIELDSGKTFTAQINNSAPLTQEHTLYSGTEVLHPTQITDFTDDTVETSEYRFSVVANTASTARIAIANNTDKAVAANFVVTAYDEEGRMIGREMVFDELSSEETITISVLCDPADSIAVVKGFVLSSDSYAPLSIAWEKNLDIPTTK